MRLRGPLITMVGLIALTNVALVWAAVDAAPARVRERPFLASRSEDEQVRARAAFSARGGTIAIRDQDRQLSITPGIAHDLEIECYRPDDPALDRTIPWDGAPHPLALAKPGRWKIRVHGSIAGDRGMLAETVVDVQ